MVSNIGLIDYGMGNLHSVHHAFKRLNEDLTIVNQLSQLDKCNALILPGVGSFDPAMRNLEQLNIIPYLKKWVKEGKPLLGICLGLQLLFEKSDEGNCQGIGLFKGNVKRLPFDQNERIPHMGWSPLDQTSECPLLLNPSKNHWMYFVHSFYAIPKDKNDLAATTKFGNFDVTAIVWKDNIGACQFHPEKSGKAGQRLLKNWLQWLTTNYS